MAEQLKRSCQCVGLVSTLGRRKRVRVAGLSGVSDSSYENACDPNALLEAFSNQSGMHPCRLPSTRILSYRCFSHTTSYSFISWRDRSGSRGRSLSGFRHSRLAHDGMHSLSVKPARNCRALEDDSQSYGVLRLPARDVEILTLLIPAIGSVFLDPAMQVIDTGRRLQALYFMDMHLRGTAVGLRSHRFTTFSVIPVATWSSRMR